MTTFSEMDLRKVYAVSHALFVELVEKRKLANIWSIGPGEKIVDGKPTGKLSIVFGVRWKLPKWLVKLSDVLGISQLIPVTVEGYPTDVQTVGKIRMFELKDRVRPVRPGYSWGNYRITAGTPGVQVKFQGVVYVDTNWHVGMYLGGKIGDAVLQPGAYDGGKNEDRVGHLQVCLEDLNTKQSAYTDYSLIQMETEFQNILPLLNVKPGPFADAKPGDDIVWVGRTSGLGEASVSQVNQDIQVDIGSGQVRYFYKQSTFRPPCKAGDSGSWVGGKGTYGTVGKVFAGSGMIGVFMPSANIRQVYQGIEVVQGNSDPIPGVEYVELFTRHETLTNWISWSRNSVPDAVDGKYRWRATTSAKALELEGPHLARADVKLEGVDKIFPGDVRRFIMVKTPPPPPPPEHEAKSTVEEPSEGQQLEVGKEHIFTVSVVVE